MLEGYIKITGYDRLYYDSTKKQYKSRMQCPYCGKTSGCFCYEDFESIPLFDEDLADTYCSNVHFVLDTDAAHEIGAEMGITIKPTMEEWNATKIVKVMLENLEADFDIPSGETCSM